MKWNPGMVAAMAAKMISESPDCATLHPGYGSVVRLGIPVTYKEHRMLTRSIIPCAFGLLLSLLATHTEAQVNRCTIGGKTVFQETPCPGARAQGGSAANGSGGETASELGKKLCREKVQGSMASRDPTSYRFGETVGGAITYLAMYSTRVRAREYLVKINAKNGQGWYVALKPIACYTNEEGNKVLLIDDLRSMLSIK